MSQRHIRTQQVPDLIRHEGYKVDEGIPDDDDARDYLPGKVNTPTHDYRSNRSV